MINYAAFTNAETAATYEMDVDFAPWQELDAVVAQRTTTDRNKAQAHGIWPTYSYRGGLEINITAQLFGDDATDYNTKRKALVAALFGLPDAAVTHRHNGTLTLGLEGESERWQTDVLITAFTCPIIAQQGFRSEYLTTFFSFNPWFIGVTTPANKYMYA